MNSESLRIADQLRRAFSGDAWHGSPIRDLLAGVTAEQAASRPLPTGHSIWELVLHIDVYVVGATEAAKGVPLPKWYGTGKDWTTVNNVSPDEWKQTMDSLFKSAERLADVIEGRDDASLLSVVPGRDYNFYHLFHGIVQHSLYHGGQIAMLKKVNALP